MFEKLKKRLQKAVTGVDLDVILQEQQSVNATLRRIEEEKAETQAKLERLKELEEKEAAEKAKKEGPEPWVEIRSAEYSEIHGFKIELDWNEAFVQYLKESGLKGRNEEEVVQKWLGFLYGDLIEKLERTVIDKVDQKRTNDFI